MAQDKGIFKSNKVRFVVFLCIIALVILGCTKVFDFADAERSDEVMDQFYGQEKDTIDCVYFGSSATQRAWVVPVAYHDEGVASYSLACGTQPFILTQYLMEEALKTQSPRLFIVEMRGLCQDPDALWDVSVRRMVDNMKPSMTKYHAIKTVTEYAKHGPNSVDLTGLSYYFPLFKYHSRWNPSKRPHYGHVDHYKGYALEPTCAFRITDIHPIPDDSETCPIDKYTEESLIQLLDYCDTIDSDVLFVMSPYEATDYGWERLNYAKDIIEDRGYEVLSFLGSEMREDVLGLGNNTCYYNREHLNMYGSLKYTDYLAKYIKDKYNVPDRRGDGKHEDWEEDYDRLMTNLNEGIYKDQYDELMTTIKEREAGAK